MLYAIGKALSRFICRVFGRWTVIGRHNIPRRGGVLICANHVSYIDPPALGAAATRQVHFMAKEELFQTPVLGYLIARVGAFPVKQKTADRAALRRAMELLKAGRVVAVFPEGTRNPDPSRLLPAELGVGMIALRAKVPVIPAALVNTDKLLPIGAKFFRLSRVKVVFGEPVALEDLYDDTGHEAFEEVGRRVMSAIGSLLDQHRSQTS